MKGCGKRFVHRIWGERICGRFEDLKHNNHYIYCEKCLQFEEERNFIIQQKKAVKRITASHNVQKNNNSHQKVTRREELNFAKSDCSSDDRCQETPGSNFAGDKLGKGNDIHAISIPDTNSHNSEEKRAGVEKETKPVKTPREKELSRQGSRKPSLTSPRDTATFHGKTKKEVKD